jgi:hypothetical protein
MNRGGLVSLRMNVLRNRNIALVRSRALVRVKCVGRLVVARLVQGSKIVPDFRDVGVESDGARVCV